MEPTAPAFTLRSYQVTAVGFLRITAAERGGALLADDCGLGKTIVALHAAPVSGSILVVCPSRSRDWWTSQIRLHYPDDLVLTAEEAGWLPKPTDPVDFHIVKRMWVIAHYEGLRLAWQYYAEVHWACIIADEAHRIRNRKTQTALKLKQLKADYKFALTATPMEQGPHDLWSILNWFDRKTFSSYWRFFDEFIDYRTNIWGGVDIKGIRPDKATELGSILGHYMLRRTKSEVAPELPPRIHSTVPLNLLLHQASLYKKIAKECEIDLAAYSSSSNESSRADTESGASLGGVPAGPVDPEPLFIKNTLSRIIRLQQVCSDPELLGVHTPSAKVEWVSEWLRDHPDEIVVVMSQFRGVAIKLASQFGGACVVGGTPHTEATKFLSGQTRLLFGTIAAAGESLNLQRASTLIFVDQLWSATKMTQAIDRIHRIDITEPKHIITLQVERSVDLLVTKALTYKFTESQIVYELLHNHGDYL